MLSLAVHKGGYRRSAVEYNPVRMTMVDAAAPEAVVGH